MSADPYDAVQDARSDRGEWSSRPGSSDRDAHAAAYFTDRCMAIIDGNFQAPRCGLKLGHEGPHEPIKVGEQTVSESPAAYTEVTAPEFAVFVEFEGRWSQADPFTFKTPEEAEARIAEILCYTFKPPTFTYHVVKRTTTDEAVT